MCRGKKAVISIHFSFHFAFACINRLDSRLKKIWIYFSKKLRNM